MTYEGLKVIKWSYRPLLNNPPPPFINACSYIYVSLCTALADSSRVLLLLFYRHQERTLTMKTISAHTIQYFFVLHIVRVFFRACLWTDLIFYCFFQQLHTTISIPLCFPGLLWDVSSFEDDTFPEAWVSVKEREREWARGLRNTAYARRLR